MTNNKTIDLVLSLFIFWIGVFGGPPVYAFTFVETQKLIANDRMGVQLFGSSVSISGDTAVIGAIRDDKNGILSGSATVFVLDEIGVWREQQKLFASDGTMGDNFGNSVSISGDTAVIGAYVDDDNGSYSGSAYVFVRNSAGVWHEQQKLTASNAAAGDFFGESVSISEDTVVIGADTVGSESGSAYVFIRDSDGMWIEHQELMGSDAARSDLFGDSVSISGDTAVIGALGDDDDGTNSGSAYIFVRDGSGLWSEQQKLTASDAAFFDFFGESVSISGDTVVIGARHDDENGGFSGAAYVFVRDNTGLWREQQKLTASDASRNVGFGESVSLSGDTIVIGAAYDDDNGFQSGSAYVFVRDGAELWSEQQKLTASDGTSSDNFGISVSISGDKAVIGSEGDDSGSGSAYVFGSMATNNDPVNVEKLINYRARVTPSTAAQLLAGTRFRVGYRVTNNSPNRIHRVRVFEDGELVCNLYALDPGESQQPYRCARNQDVLVGIFNLRATVTAKVSGSNQELADQTNAYYIGRSNVSGELTVTHYVNNRNANTQDKAVAVNGNETEVLFRVVNTGNIELYRIRTYHEPASPINSGWQQQCYIGTLLPGQVRYCKRTLSVTHAGLNKAFGRAQGENANVSPTGFVNASNPTYFNVVLP